VCHHFDVVGVAAKVANRVSKPKSRTMALCETTLSLEYSPGSDVPRIRLEVSAAALRKRKETEAIPTGVVVVIDLHAVSKSQLPGGAFGGTLAAARNHEHACALKNSLARLALQVGP
jgi:hypothetical protein